MKLYVCWSTTAAGGHPCGRAAEAVRAAGHDPQIRYALGWRALPDVPFNLTPGRRRVKELTGSSDVPVLELDDGTAIGGTRAIIDWARANPA
ncbi:MAG: glutathione S-transferase N-terminal domain-containing protein [Solirubrobacteraceae bacterium]